MRTGEESVEQTVAAAPLEVGALDAEFADDDDDTDDEDTLEDFDDGIADDITTDIGGAANDDTKDNGKS